MNTNTIIGYRVQDHNGMFVDFDGVQNFRTYSKPEPISQANAYRRLAAFLDANPGVQVPRVVPVYYEPTPVEKASKELGGLLESLCSRHGLDLGLTSEQIQKQIAKELEALKAGGSSFVATGIPRIGR